MSEDQGFSSTLVNVNHVVTALAIVFGAIGGTTIEQRITRAEDREDAIYSLISTATAAQTQMVGVLDKDTERVAVLENDIKRLEQGRTDLSISLTEVRQEQAKIRDRLEQIEVILGALNGGRK